MVIESSRKLVFEKRLVETLPETGLCPSVLIVT